MASGPSKPKAKRRSTAELDAIRRSRGELRKGISQFCPSCRKVAYARPVPGPSCLHVDAWHLPDLPDTPPRPAPVVGEVVDLAERRDAAMGAALGAGPRAPAASLPRTEKEVPAVPEPESERAKPLSAAAWRRLAQGNLFDDLPQQRRKGGDRDGKLQGV